ncbi:MAG: ATP-dependent helicase, partial [Thiomonas sp.]
LKRLGLWDPKNTELRPAKVVSQLLEYKLRLHRLGFEGHTTVDILNRPGYCPWILRSDEIGAGWLQEVHAGYETEKADSSLLDFTDLLVLPRRIFLETPAALADFRERTTHLLVDEFQDTDSDQYALIRLLHQDGKGSRTLVVGDDDQSLYGWRGALPGIFRRFVADTGATLYRLEENYRCQPWILECANHVIRNNRERYEKTLRPNRGQEQALTIEQYTNPQEEAQALLQHIGRYLEAGLAPQDIAVLYRVNRFSAEVEKALLRARIPYRVYGGTGFFQREEIRHALAYLRLAWNPDDDVAFRRIVDVPRRQIGPKTLEDHADFALEWGKS